LIRPAVTDDENRARGVAVKQPLERVLNPRVKLRPRFATVQRIVRILPPPLVCGVARMTFERAQAPFVQTGQGDQWRGTVHEGGRLATAPKLTRIHRVEVQAADLLSELHGLPASRVVKRDIRASLEPLLPVPVRLTVSRQIEPQHVIVLRHEQQRESERRGEQSHGRECTRTRSSEAPDPHPLSAVIVTLIVVVIVATVFMVASIIASA
jgi:hypothetical protein